MALLNPTKYKQMLQEPLRLAFRIIEKDVPCIRMRMLTMTKIELIYSILKKKKNTT